MWFLFQGCQEGTWLKDTRCFLQSFPLAQRLVPIASVSFSSSLSFCHRYCAFRACSSNYNNRRIQFMYSTYWEEWVKISSDRDWLRLRRYAPGNRSAAFYETHRADTSLPPTPFPSHYNSEIVSFTFLFIIILYYLLCYFTRYIVTCYRLLSLLLRLL